MRYFLVPLVLALLCSCSSSTKYSVETDVLLVRALPSKSAPIVSKLKRGELVRIDSFPSGWGRVVDAKVDSAINGYVHGNYLVEYNNTYRRSKAFDDTTGVIKIFALLLIPIFVIQGAKDGRFRSGYKPSTFAIVAYGLTLIMLGVICWTGRFMYLFLFT
jgi:hypothetical protein